MISLSLDDLGNKNSNIFNIELISKLPPLGS
jgi:hypothetical protein